VGHKTRLTQVFLEIQVKSRYCKTTRSCETSGNLFQPGVTR